MGGRGPRAAGLRARRTRYNPGVHAAHLDVQATPPGPILLIDDEPFILRSLGFLLTREGYRVETASNGEEGLERIKALRPPIVFVDVMMPRMNGYELCEQVKQDPQLAGTYLIILSAKGQQIDRERGLLGGADEYMTKPFSPRDVLRRVREILEGVGP